MILIKDLLKQRGNHVYTIPSTATVFEALGELADKDIGALVVVDDGQLVGMFSERDYARKIVLKGLSSKISKVGELMTTKVFTISPEKSIEECMKLMSSKKIRHVPVVERGKLVGLVSIGDVVNRIIYQQTIAIKDLENYIIGGYRS